MTRDQVLLQLLKERTRDSAGAFVAGRSNHSQIIAGENGWDKTRSLVGLFSVIAQTRRFPLSKCHPEPKARDLLRRFRGARFAPQRSAQPIPRFARNDTLKRIGLYLKQQPGPLHQALDTDISTFTFQISRSPLSLSPLPTPP